MKQVSKLAFILCITLALTLIVVASYKAMSQGISLLSHPAYLVGLLLLLISQFVSAKWSALQK